MEEKLLKILIVCFVIIAIGSLAYMLIFPYVSIQPPISSSKTTTTQQTTTSIIQQTTTTQKTTTTSTTSIVQIGEKIEVAEIIYIYPDRFEPSSLTIKAGEAVTWVNMDTKVRTIGISSPLMDGRIEPGKNLTQDFYTPGTVQFWDVENEELVGSIQVE